MPGWLSRSQCSWHIVALPHQRINLTLTDFSQSSITSTLDSFDNAFAQSIRCEAEYALIVDKPAGRNTSICAGKKRHTHVYLSRSNIIDIFIDGTGSDQRQRSPERYFIIKYQGNVMK